MSRYRKALAGASAVALLAAVTAFALSGCSSSAPPVKSESVESVVETGTPFQSNRGIAGSPWYETLASIPLDTALSKADGAVSLPDASSVGTITHLSLDPTAGSEDGKPGLLVLYSSGVQLSVGYGARELQVETTFGPFEDGRKTADTLRQVDGTPVLVTEPGTQTPSHRGDNRVDAMVIWNAGGLRYVLTASNENQSTDHLIAIMRTMRPATR